jgi:hypothetical protein
MTLDSDLGVFPFGQKVKPVAQADRSPKRVFVLGVYASAVHATWLDETGGIKISALAVASEPEIFWRGTNATLIVEKIPVPKGAGKLRAASARLNGPSGRSLNDQFLGPLTITRSDAWLCDLYPFARMNPRQKKAIEREYAPLVRTFNLPEPTMRPAPTKGPGERRVGEIWQEFTTSRAKTMILLGDKPVDWFLRLLGLPYRRLSEFGETIESYGQLHELEIQGVKLNLLPLVHPRQASRLGASSQKWSALHQEWVEDVASHLL